MNKNYLRIDFESNLAPGEMLQALRSKFPQDNWHGSDSDAQGPSISSIANGRPHFQIFFDQAQVSFCMNFSNLCLDGAELEECKERFAAYFRAQILPLLRGSPQDHRDNRS